MAGNDNSSNAETGPVKVIVKQDGIGRTGGIVLGVFAGVAFGMSVMSVVFQSSSNRDHESQLSSTEARLNSKYQENETETRMLEYYLLELDAKVISSGIKKPEEAIAKKLDEARK